MAVATGFSIANTALSAFRVASEVAGHNIANIHTEGYSRQRAEFVSNTPQKLSYGNLGTGVNLSAVNRTRSAYLDKQLNRENSELGFWEMNEDTLQQLELYFDESSDTGVSSLMGDFFDGWQELSSNPEDQATRVSLVQKSVLMANSINEQVTKMRQLRSNIDEAVNTKVNEVNSLVLEIADLNSRVVSAESDGNMANDLRDSRDLKLSQLSKIIDFESFEQGDGAVTITFENKTMVFGNSYTELEVFSSGDDAPFFPLRVRWADTQAEVVPEQGELGGLMYSRDTVIPKFEALLDDVAHSLVENVNRIHTQGRGTVNFAELEGTYGVSDPTALLTDSSVNGLDISPQNGTFDIIVVDAGGNEVNHTITVDGTTTLNSLAAAITATDADITATVNAENELEIAGSNGVEFAFANDNSDTLMALGINTFFKGYDAQDIAVNDTVIDNGGYVAAGKSSAPGDNSNALDVATLRNTSVLVNGTQTIEEYYSSSVVGELGTQSSEAQRVAENQKLITDQIQDSIDETSSVSIDEEMTNIIQLQHATAAMARYITIIGDMLNEVVGILR